MEEFGAVLRHTTSTRDAVSVIPLVLVNRLRSRWQPHYLTLMVVLACTAFSPRQVGAHDTWRYVAPSKSEAFSSARFRKMDLSMDAPDILNPSKVFFLGREQWFGLIRVGSPRSQRIPIVLDVHDDERFDLYVDTDRNHVIERRDLIDGHGRFRAVTVNAELTRDFATPRLLPRCLVFRSGHQNSSLSAAIGGYVEGQVTLGDTTVLARRVDGDSNGLFADARDQLWIDENNDGLLDPFLENLPHSPMLQVKGVSYRVIADAAGERLMLKPIEGEGVMKLEVESLSSAADVVESEVTLWGDDGSVFSFQGLGQAFRVPAGQYTIGAVRLCIKVDGTQDLWSFEFSRNSLSDHERWHTITPDTELVVDPVGELRFDIVMRDDQIIRSGHFVSVRPVLTTSDGLLVNGSRVGSRLIDRNTNNHADISIADKNGTVATSNSGFS